MATPKASTDASDGPGLNDVIKKLAVGFSFDGVPEVVYSRVAHELAKVHLMNLHMLFDGEVLTLTDGRLANDGYLPFRFSAEQRSRAAAACRDLFEILMERELEPTPMTSARGDRQFQAFLRRSTTKPQRRRRGAR